ncbi:ABC-F family ATP-binding cassette domain-containing protein [Acidipropionibacterium virtanenii]|uniref:Putative ABC transporter ATP-binding protein YbiT n=1 Tax=Acidipropionibacterium virtanenii TaxID=2057246 RepID=A0A344UV27_9ACTN|nr:ABC-F family ATP-binding cassette domain-containing protein [Acidipropionibacterium virtanenii]AXE39125.1 putative ABC transporter ATP-binding protein YbiT [Acidipropionibacterium virtanenii]
MSITQKPAVTLADLSFTWPDGAPAISHLSATFTVGRTGLIGDNGTGKTTLLRLIAGDLAPTAGTVSVTGRVGYLPQHLTLRTGATVAELLGVDQHLTALRAIESGDADPAHFEALADDWDVEARSLAELHRIGLPGIGLDRPVATLSGGETVLAALTGLRLSRDDVVLLDEPTNNLDRDSRHLLYEALGSWTGSVVVVSHDVALLNLMDATAELRDGSLTVFGGPYDAYQDHLATEQAAAEQALRSAEQQLRTEQRQRIEAQTKLARRRRYARTDFENKRKPKIIMNNRKQEAQVSAGKLRGQLDASVDAAKQAVDEQGRRIRRDATISISLPDPDVPAARRLAELSDDQGHRIFVQGPERVALTGRNGIGKTRLLETLIHCAGAPGTGGRAEAFTDRIGYLPQRLDLDDDATILQMLRGATPSATEGELRAGLAHFLFRGDVVDRRVGDLSGGERFRVALAELLLTDPPNQLLILDEPTNNLDLHSVDELVDALSAYHGGLIVVSHDDAFLSRLGIGTWIAMDDDGLHQDAPVR